MRKRGDERRLRLGWFAPDFWNQRALLRNVAITALGLRTLALAMSIFFQIVIDRILVSAGAAVSGTAYN